VKLDGRAVATGAAVALVFAVPAAVISALLVEDDASNGVFVFYAIILFGMLLGGFVAGAKRPDLPYTHGAAAAALAYVVAQVVAVAVKAADGGKVRSPVVYVFNLLLAASLGVVGGYLAERRGARVS